MAVVGGGISGLAAAWFTRQLLGAEAAIVVYEKNDDIGGLLRVSDVAGLPVDEGAESLLARRPEAVGLVKAVGMAADIVHPALVKADLWSRNRLWALPANTVMGVPQDPHQLVGILTETEIAIAAADASVPGMPINDDVSIGQLVQQRFGAAVVDRLVDPMLGGVYAGQARELSLDATVPALAAAARRCSSLATAVAAARSAQRGSPGPTFAGINGGVGRLSQAVATASTASIRTGVTVRELRRSQTQWQLVTGPATDPRVIDADAVIMAIPAAPAARLLSCVAPVAGTELAAVETASMAIVTIALNRSACPSLPAASGLLIPPIDGHVVKAVTYSSLKWPWLGEQASDLLIIRASIGRRGQIAELQRDDADLVKAVLDELSAAIGLAGQPVDWRVTRWGGALPQYAVGHRGKVERIRAAVAAAPGLAVCGAVYDGVGVAACVASAGDAAKRVAGYLRGRHARIEA